MQQNLIQEIGVLRYEANFSCKSLYKVASSSRRFEPSSRTTLMGEQPNPWNVLPLQDVTSRHRHLLHFSVIILDYVIYIRNHYECKDGLDFQSLL